MKRNYLLGAFALGLVLCAMIWMLRTDSVLGPAKLVTVSAPNPSAPVSSTRATPTNRVADRVPDPEHAASPETPIVPVSGFDAQSSSASSPLIPRDSKSSVMSDEASFNALINALNAWDREVLSEAYDRLGEDGLLRLILQRMQEVSRRAAAGEHGAQHLQFMVFEMCTRARPNANFSAECPVYAAPEQAYEQAFWRALTQGVPTAYSMGDVFIDLKPNQDDYYSSAREILLRQRQIYLEQVEAGSCIALDWLGYTYGYGARSDSALTDPRLAYRYRYALTQLVAGHFTRVTNLMDAALKPEITAVERAEAGKLLDRAFRNRPEHPSCKEYRTTP